MGTVRMCAVSLLWLIAPALRRAEAQRQAADAAFDQQYGVDNGGVFRAKQDDVVGENWALGGNYQAVDPSTFQDALKAVPVAHSEFTFVDFGSGKGRALLLACGFPFRRVVGVEYCKKLNAVARENVRRFPSGARRCDVIEIVDADAAEYPLPNEPLMLFLYHPFAEPVMARVVENVAESFRKHPRRIVVIYLFPYFARLWEAAGCFKRIHSTPAIFDTGAASGNGGGRRQELRPDPAGSGKDWAGPG